MMQQVLFDVSAGQGSLSFLPLPEPFWRQVLLGAYTSHETNCPWHTAADAQHHEDCPETFDMALDSITECKEWRRLCRCVNRDDVATKLLLDGRRHEYL